MKSLILALGATLSLLGTVGCGERADATSLVPGGDPERGRQWLRSYGCVSCHTIPGVRGADALVGPPLTRLAARVYVAGHLPNTPENLVRWIQHPQQVSPGTAMPNTGVTDEHVLDIAAYLYTLH